jgi:hypothetical protein
MIIGFSTIAFIPKKSQKMNGYVKQDNGRNQRKEEKFTKKINASNSDARRQPVSSEAPPSMYLNVTNRTKEFNLN